MNRHSWMLVAALLAPTAAGAQILRVPTLPTPAGDLMRGLDESIAQDGLLQQVERTARTLGRERLDRLRNIARLHPDVIELDSDGNPVRAREIVVEDPDDAFLAQARAAGFSLLERQTIDDLDIGYARFRVPPGTTLRTALKRLRAIAGDRSVATDPLHFSSGSVAPAALPDAPLPLGVAPANTVSI
jgi:minor extracellular protease Epr